MTTKEMFPEGLMPCVEILMRSLGYTEEEAMKAVLEDQKLLAGCVPPLILEEE